MPRRERKRRVYWRWSRLVRFCLHSSLIICICYEIELPDGGQNCQWTMTNAASPNFPQTYFESCSILGSTDHQGLWRVYTGFLRHKNPTLVNPELGSCTTRQSPLGKPSYDKRCRFPHTTYVHTLESRSPGLSPSVIHGTAASWLNS